MKSIWITKLKEAKTTKAMTIILLVLLGIITASVLAFAILLTRLTLDDADFWLKVVSGVFAAIVFASGLAALVTGHFAGQAQANKIQAQAEKMGALEKEAAEARRDAATANERAENLALRIEEEARKRAEAEERLERLRKRISPRGINNADPLFRGSKGSAEILFQKDDPEAFMFARYIFMNLQMAGWNVSVPKPLISIESAPYLPASMAAGGNDSDVTVLACFLESEPDNSDTPYATLHKFFRASNLGLHCRMEASLPPDFFRIVIGPKW